jgi:hypothetical protein
MEIPAKEDRGDSRYVVFSLRIDDGTGRHTYLETDGNNEVEMS